MPALTSSQILIGINSILGQILLLRELSVLFYGNELSYGITLACWLMWTAVGSGILGRFSDRIHAKHGALASCQILLALTLPATIFLVRSAIPIFGLGFGEVIGLGAMVGLAALVQLPLGVTIGFYYTMACAAYKDYSGSSEQSIGKTYLYEAVGAVIGGVGFTYFIDRFDHFQMTLGLTFLNLACATWVLAAGKKRWPVAIPAVILGAVLLFHSGIYTRIQYAADKLQWPGYQVEESIDSRYGKVSLLVTQDQHSLYQNGLLLFTVPDLLSAEEAVHFPLLAHPDPQYVLMVGGGMGGGLIEILKHPSLEKVIYAEIDPAIVEIGKNILSVEDRGALDDPRIEIKNIDGRLVVKSVKMRFDVVLINIPDPSTAQLNRFYTWEFFKEVKRLLKPGGMLSLSLSSSENYLSIEQKNLLHSVYRTLKKEFSSVTVLPGGNNFLFAGDTPYDLSPELLIKRHTERKLETTYVREYYIPYRLSPERREYIDRVLAEDVPVKLNRDYFPVSYYYNLILWVTSFSPTLRGFFNWLLKVNLMWFSLGILGVMVVFFLFIFRRRMSKSQAAVLWAVGTTGFAEISFEVILIVAFQMIYGYVYYKIGIIMAGFMIGLAAGSFWANRYPSPKPYRFLIIIQALVCCYPLLLIGILYYYSIASEGFLRLTEPLFGFLPVVAGLMGGLQYPHANKVFPERSSKTAQVAGLTYGVDLLGSCLGALLTASLLIPVLGLYQTCLAAAVINILALEGLIIGRRT